MRTLIVRTPIRTMDVLKEEIRKIYKGSLVITSNELEVRNLATNTDYTFGSSWSGSEILNEVSNLVNTYGVYVNTERDNFSLEVRNYLDNTVFELQNDDLAQFIEDGFIRYATDVYSLEKYLTKELKLSIHDLKLM